MSFFSVYSTITAQPLVVILMPVFTQTQGIHFAPLALRSLTSSLVPNHWYQMKLDKYLASHTSNSYCCLLPWAAVIHKKHEKCGIVDQWKHTMKNLVCLLYSESFISRKLLHIQLYCIWSNFRKGKLLWFSQFLLNHESFPVNNGL